MMGYGAMHATLTYCSLSKIGLNGGAADTAAAAAPSPLTGPAAAAPGSLLLLGRHCA